MKNTLYILCLLMNIAFIGQTQDATPIQEKTIVWSKIENGYQVQLIREANHEYILKTPLELLQVKEEVHPSEHYVSPAYEVNYVIPEVQTNELINQRLQNLYYTGIPLTLNADVRKEIDRLLANRRSIEEALGRSQYFIPFADSVLSTKYLPSVLKYLPLVESNYKPSSYSRVGAGGIWQFMRGTGRMYGLKVNNLEDHRLDPKKSTVAAFNYLEDLYLLYNDWYLALAAYNCGPGRVNRAINYAGVENPTFWDIKNHLPRETRRYIPRFIAAVYVMEHANQIGLLPNWEEYDSVKAECETLHKANYKKKVIYSATAKQVPIPQNSTVVTYTVKSGDNLGFIAEWYDVSAKQLRGWNGISGNLIKPGQLINIYVPEDKVYVYADIDKISQNHSKREDKDSTSNDAPVIASTSSRNYVNYTIKSGDTLWEISRKNGVSIEEIKQLNNISNIRNLKPGMVIKIKEKS